MIPFPPALALGTLQTPMKILIGAAVALGLYLAGVLSGLHYAGLKEKARAAEVAVAVAETKARQATVTAQATARIADSTTRIERIFVERQQEQEAEYEAREQANAGCTIPNRTVRLWNSANQLRHADAPGPADNSPSGVALTDVESQHDREARICHLWIDRAKQWERWYAEQVKASQNAAADRP